MELVSSCVSTTAETPEGPRRLFPVPSSPPTQLVVWLHSDQGPLLTKIGSGFMQGQQMERWVGGGEKNSH